MTRPKILDPYYPFLTDMSLTDDPDSTTEGVIETAMDVMNHPNEPKIQTLDQDDLKTNPPVETVHGPDSRSEDAAQAARSPQFPGPIAGVRMETVFEQLKNILQESRGVAVRSIAPPNYSTMSITIDPGRAYPVSGRDNLRTRVLLRTLSTDGNLFAGPTQSQAVAGQAMPVGQSLEIFGADDVWVGAPATNLGATTVFVLVERYNG